jgi:PKD repeat protein
MTTTNPLLEKMMRQQKTWCILPLLLVLFLSSFLNVNAQVIVGPTNVCFNTQSTYTRANPNNYLATWTVSSNGSIVSSTNTSCTVFWLTNNATSTVSCGFASGGIPPPPTTLTVNVQKTPKPFITYNNQVGCQLVSEDGDLPPDENDFANNLPLLGVADGKCIRVCENSRVVYSVTGQVGSTYVWSTPAGGAIFGAANLATCTIDWGTFGMGFVEVTETTSGGCVGTRKICIEKIKSPTANFNIIGFSSAATAITICKGQEVFFSDLSNVNGGSNINNWYWVFGDGATSTLQNPSHIYATPGVYTGSLTVTNACNCTSAKRIIQITVTNTVAPNITCITTGCESESQTYTINNVPCATNTWTVTGGQIVGAAGAGLTINNQSSISVIWNNLPSNGLATVSVQPNCSGGCNAPVSIIVPIIKGNGLIDGPSFMCVGEQVLVKVPQYPGSTYRWSFNGNASMIRLDQNNERFITANGTGDIKINVEYTNKFANCQGFASLTIKATTKPVITGIDKLCKGSAQTFGLSPTQSAAWQIKQNSAVLSTATGTSIAYTFANAGAYEVIAVPTSSCNPENLTVQVLPPPATPVAITGEIKACANLPYPYTASPAIAGTIFVWSITNGTLNSTVGGTVTAKWNAGLGARVISVKRVYIASPNCESPSIPLNVGDATGSVQFNTYNPTVTTFNQNQCSNTITPLKYYGVDFNRGEDYQWTIIPASVGSIISGQGTQFIQIQWNNSVGVTTATLGVKIKTCNNFGIVNTSLPITLNGGTAILTSPASNLLTCGNLPINFTLSGISSANFSIDYGDNSPVLTGTNFAAIPSHVYTNILNTNATNNVIISLTNINGCPTASQTINTTIIVKPTPDAVLSPFANILVDCNQSFAQTLTASQNTSGAVTYLWYFNGILISGATNSTYTPINNASSAGLYSCQIIGTNGCSDFTNSVEIIDNCSGSGGICVSAYSPNLTTSNNCGVISANLSFTSNGGNTNLPSGIVFLGASGIGSPYNVVIAPSGTSNANYSVSNAGQYVVNVKMNLPEVGVPNGVCVFEENTSIIVPYVPKFIYGLVCGSGNYTINLTSTSTFYPSTPITAFTYELLNSSSAVIQTVFGNATGQASFINVAAGATYFIRLTINGSAGQCITVIPNVVAPSFPSASFTSNPSGNACVNTPINFTNTSTGGVSYFWDYTTGTGNSQGSSTLFNSSKEYSSALNPANISLTVKNSIGCSAIATTQKTILANPFDVTNGTVPPTGTPNPQCILSPVAMNYNNTLLIPPPTVTNYQWVKQPNNVLISLNLAAPAGANFNVLQSAGYAVILTHTNGCKKLTNYVGVSFNETPDPIIYGKSDVCIGEPFKLEGYAGPIPNISYTWKKKSGAIYTTVQTGINSGLDVAAINTAGTVIYQLVISVTTGTLTCTRTSADYTITVNPQPNSPVLNAAMGNCGLYNVSLTATNAATGTYNWSNFMGGANITVTNGGIYKCYFTSTATGCKSSQTINIPKDPEAFLWTLPSGCYQICEEEYFTNGLKMTVPIPKFVNWNFFNPSTFGSYLSATTNPSNVTPFTVVNDGAYALSASSYFNSSLWCQRTSKTLNLTSIECAPACIITATPQLGGATAITLPNGACAMRFNVLYNNPGTSKVMHLTSVDGAIFPVSPVSGGIVAASGPTSVAYYFVPRPTASITAIRFKMSNYPVVANAGYCNFTSNLSAFPNCGIPFIAGRSMNANNDEVVIDNTTIENQVRAAFENSIVISPNPANENIQLDFITSTITKTEKASSDKKQIRIAQLSGKIVWEQTTIDGENHFNISTADWSNGMYEVSIIENGRKLQSKKLSILH